MQEQELIQIEAAIEAVNAVKVEDKIKVALVADLKPIAGRLQFYADAVNVPVTNQVEADAAEQICKQIAADVKAVKEQEVLSKITTGLHELHRKFTGLRDLFLTPMESNRKTIKNKIGAWQQQEQEKAEALQRKLQAEAEAKARAEQEKLLKKAESMKTPEKQEQYREQAQAVIVPTITIAAAKTGMKFSTRWKVKEINHDAFFAALATDKSLRGYVDIKTTAMERVKAGNLNIEIAGVTFEKVRV